MTNFSVNGVQYDRMQVYMYLGNVLNQDKLKRTFKDYHIVNTGSANDLKKLNDAMYQDYTKQVQNLAANQNNEEVTAPWVNLCKRIGVPTTGNYDTDLAAFRDGIEKMKQSHLTPELMSLLASVESEAQTVFSLSANDGYKASLQNNPANNLTFENFRTQHLW